MEDSLIKPDSISDLVDLFITTLKDEVEEKNIFFVDTSKCPVDLHDGLHDQGIIGRKKLNSWRRYNLMTYLII